MNALLLDLAIIIIYFLIIIGLGLYMGRREDNLSEFALGGRRIPWWAVLASIIAAETSAATFLGAPAEGYRLQNILYVQLTLGTILARFIIAFLFIKPYYQHGVFTVYEFLEKRFGMASRVAGSLIFLITRLLASGVRVYIGAVVLVIAWKFLADEPPGLRHYFFAITLLTLATTIYTMLGGIKAVIWTDLIQACIMFGGALFSLVLIVKMIPGHWHGILSGTDHFANFKVFASGLTEQASLKENILGILAQEYTLFAALLGATFLTMATHGTDQDMVQRMLTSKTYKQSRLSLILSGIMDVPIALAFVMIGIFLFAYFQEQPDPALPKATNEIFAYFIVTKIPAGARGLIIAGVFATAMGSLSAALNALATSFVKDFYIPFFKKGIHTPLPPSQNPAPLTKTGVLRFRLHRAILSGRILWTRVKNNEKHDVWAARIFTAVFGVLMIIVATLSAYSILHRPNLTIIPIALGIIGYTYGPMLGMFLIGMLTKTRGNNLGNILGMVCGFLTVFILSGTCNHVLRFLNLSPLPVPKIAFTWYILFGSLVTFGVGVLFKSRPSIQNLAENSSKETLRA